MPRLSLSCTHIASLALVWTCALSAFEQSSYHVFDLVRTDASEPIAGRLAVPASAMDAAATESAQPLQAERGEFEIDYNASMQATTGSSFEYIAPLENTSELESVNFSTENFEFGTPTTVFGD